MALYPPLARGMIDLNAARGHPFLQGTVTDAVFAGPTYRPEDNVVLDVAMFEPIHGRPQRDFQSMMPEYRLFATEPRRT